MRIRSVWTVVLLILAVVVLGSAAAWSKPATGSPYVIGAIFSVTGDASSLGVPEANTARMLEGMINAQGGINGHVLKIVIEDDRGDPAEALNAARRLVERDNVLAIIGPSRTGTTMAIKDYLEKERVPLISCAAGIEIVEPVQSYVFKTPQSDRMAVAKIVTYLKSKHITRVASISDNTAFGKGGLRELQTRLPKAGIKLLLSEEFGPKDPSMESQLTKIRGMKPPGRHLLGYPSGAGHRRQEHEDPWPDHALDLQPRRGERRLPGHRRDRLRKASCFPPAA